MKSDKDEASCFLLLVFHLSSIYSSDALRDHRCHEATTAQHRYRPNAAGCYRFLSNASLAKCTVNKSASRTTPYIAHPSRVIPLLRLHSHTPLSTSSLLTPSRTSQNVTPSSVSTLRFRPSSSKNSMSANATSRPLLLVAFCIRRKWLVLLPGKIWMWAKMSTARIGFAPSRGLSAAPSASFESAEGSAGIVRPLNIFLARSGTCVRLARPIVMPRSWAARRIAGTPA